MTKLSFYLLCSIGLISFYSCTRNDAYLCRCIYIATPISSGYGQFYNDSLLVYGQNEDAAYAKCEEHGYATVDTLWDFGCSLKID